MSRARHNMEKECRAKGGRVGMVVSGNPDVLEEAHEKHARGGKVKKKRGMMAEGHKPAHRMDRPRRRRADGGSTDSLPNPFMSMGSSSTSMPSSPGPVQIVAPTTTKRGSRVKKAAGGRVSGSDRNPFSSAHRSGKTGERSGGEPD